MTKFTIGETIENVNEVVDVKYVPHLFSISIDGDGFVRECGYDEPGQPTLIFDAELSLSVNATHPEDPGFQTVGVCKFLNIDISSQLGRSIRAMAGSIDRHFFRYSRPEEGIVKGVPVFFFPQSNSIHIFSVDLVSAAEEDRGVV